MIESHVIAWLLEGDVSIQFQVFRDLLGENRTDLQDRIAYEGWGQQFLSQRKKNRHWGDRFYQPKWISSHYTLLDLRNLNINQENWEARDSIQLILDTCIADDGGIKLGPSTAVHTDVCVNGMFLNYASYFKMPEEHLRSIVDALLNELMPDGGFNCRTTRSGAVHSSLHSTISVLEGLLEFKEQGFQYRKNDIEEAMNGAEGFILLHKFFISDRTGEVIKKDFLKLTYPSRWKYDILRGLDYFRYANRRWDHRMQEAIKVIQDKRNRKGTWNLQAAHPGKVHFTMEKAGQPSRWNTLRALRVLKHFELL